MKISLVSKLWSEHDWLTILKLRRGKKVKVYGFLFSAHRVAKRYIYTKFRENISRVSELWSGHENTDGRKDGWIDGHPKLRRIATFCIGR